MNAIILLGFVNVTIIIACWIAKFIDWHDELKEERRRKSPNRTKPW